MERAAERIRAAGLRLTSGRVAVLRAVESRPHSDADRIAAVVRAQIGSISTQAVYDALRALTEAGLLRRFQPAGQSARYETRVGDNHHHLICRGCGVTEDVTCAVGSPPCLAPSEDHGFTLVETEVTYWGYCPACHINHTQNPTKD